MNFLNETRAVIGNRGLCINDIIFIGSESSGHQCTWAEFETLADREYDPSYGSAEVATDLVVIFKDGTRMHRGEYDGSEWWEVARPFVRPAITKPITSLFGGGWSELEGINNLEKQA